MIVSVLLGGVISFLFWFRVAQISKFKIFKQCAKLILSIYRTIYGLEIYPSTNIGPGLYLGHAFNITVNPKTIIGSNCNLHKGVTIGQSNRGAKKGVPVIGNDVWIGCNAAIVGKIQIGDDVLIAPNSFVNCDIPSHSVVFGNPCVIKQKQNATDGYIINKIVL